MNNNYDPYSNNNNNINNLNNDLKNINNIIFNVNKNIQNIEDKVNKKQDIDYQTNKDFNMGKIGFYNNPNSENMQNIQSKNTNKMEIDDQYYSPNQNQIINTVNSGSKNENNNSLPINNSTNDSVDTSR